MADKVDKGINITKGECLIRIFVLGISIVPLFLLVFTNETSPFLISTLSIITSCVYDLYSQRRNLLHTMQKIADFLMIWTILVFCVIVGYLLINQASPILSFIIVLIDVVTCGLYLIMAILQYIQAKQCEDNKEEISND